MKNHHAYVAMNVSSVTEDPFTRMPMVILRDNDGGAHVALAVGMREAPAIAAALRGIAMERPSTHQLTCRLLEAAGARIDRVEIVDTSSARIVLVRDDGPDGNEISQPARCSDAIAIALHASATLWVARAVLDQSERISLASDQNPCPKWMM